MTGFEPGLEICDLLILLPLMDPTLVVKIRGCAVVIKEESKHDDWYDMIWVQSLPPVSRLRPHPTRKGGSWRGPSFNTGPLRAVLVAVAGWTSTD